MKRIIAVFFLTLILSFWTTPTFAANGVESGVAGEASQGTGQEDTQNGGMSIEQASDPEYVLGIKDGDYSVDHIGDKLKNKGMDIVYLLKVVGRYVCLAAFVICCILLVLGIVGNTRMLLRSSIGAIISGVMYAAITCGEEIVQLIAGWAAA